MRILYLLRGAPGAGKSTWVKENKLEPYTLSADSIRLMLQSPVMDEQGAYKISQSNDRRTWDMLLELLEERMRRGEFIIVDATHYKSSLLNYYKRLASEYRYRTFVVDFTQVPKEVALERNRSREAYRFVPEPVIEKMYAVFEQDHEVSNRYNVLTPEAALAKLQEEQLFDYNKYDEVVVFGDIHGCYEPLRQWFEQHPFSESNGYVFAGDYIDRGLQNKETVELLLKLSAYKNVLFLEGNHEKWLRLYAEDKGAEQPLDKYEVETLNKYDRSLVRRLQQHKIRSSEFLNYTQPQLGGLKLKDLRQFCRRLGQMAYFRFGDKKILVTHGGTPRVPDIFTATAQIIEGTGRYEATDVLYEAWARNTAEDTLQLHGHRNELNHPIAAGTRIYNLCSKIEEGGALRIARLYRDGEVRTQVEGHEIINPLPNGRILERRRREAEHTAIPQPPATGDIDGLELLRKLTASRLIRKNVQGHITSYNFTREAFNDRKWNQLTCTARGLFVENESFKIIARSYNKFFNWQEMSFTSAKALKENLQFPVTAYRKENGFLALLAYDWVTDQVLTCSKSMVEGNYPTLIRQQYDRLSQSTKDKIKAYLQANSCTMVFECVAEADDTHPIVYAKEHLYLLDIVDNSFTFRKLPYDQLVQVAKELGLEVKAVAGVFSTWEELLAFKTAADKQQGPTIEGYVFEDSTSFMVKYKLPFYNYWKYQRGLLENLKRRRTPLKNFRDERDVRVYNLMQGLQAERTPEDFAKTNIKEIEQLYYGEELVPVDAAD